MRCWNIYLILVWEGREKNEREWKQKVLCVMIILKNTEYLEKHTFNETYSEIKIKRLLNNKVTIPLKHGAWGILWISALFNTHRHQVNITWLIFSPILKMVEQIPPTQKPCWIHYNIQVGCGTILGTVYSVIKFAFHLLPMHICGVCFLNASFKISTFYVATEAVLSWWLLHFLQNTLKTLHSTGMEAELRALITLLGLVWFAGRFKYQKAW